mgnify:CR=1 FL=1
MYDDDEYGEENPLKVVLNKFAAKVQKKTAKNSLDVLTFKSYYKNKNLDTFTVFSMSGQNHDSLVCC